MSSYTMIPNSLLEHIYASDLTKRELKILLYIARKTFGYHADSAQINITHMAEDINVDRSHCSKAIRSLLNSQLITATATNQYQITCEQDLSASQTQGVAETATPVAETAIAKTATPVRPKQLHQCSQNSLKTVAKTATHIKKKEIIKETFKEIGPDLPGWLDVELWTEFVKFRKKVKSPLTEHAAKLAIKKLADFRGDGYDPSDIIEQSIVNGWKGLFPLKDKKPPERFKDKDYSVGASNLDELGW